MLGPLVILVMQYVFPIETARFAIKRNDGFGVDFAKVNRSRSSNEFKNRSRRVGAA